jgi:cell division protein FtsW (lipid II flippase)
MGAGVGVMILITFWVAWQFRSGRPREPRKTATRLIVVAFGMLVVPLSIAIAMPDFPTALVVWFGFAIGTVVAKVVTIPLSLYFGRRIERRTVT